MGIRKDRKKETVQRILDAAVHEFAETGYAGARMDAIANRAGVNKAMIYYHIGDKKTLYTQVLHDVFKDALTRLTASIARVNTPEEKIKAYIRSIGQTFVQHQDLHRIMMREMASGGLNLPEIVVTDLAAIIRTITEIVADGRARGGFHDINPFCMHMMLIGGLSYFKATAPIRRNYAHLMREIADEHDIETDPDPLVQIERIILGALGHGDR